MTDYIEREEVLKILFDWCGLYDPPNTRPLKEALCALPAANVREVVLCRDCKYYNTTGCADGYGWCEDSVVSTGVCDNFFCGRAETRGEADGT